MVQFSLILHWHFVFFWKQLTLLAAGAIPPSRVSGPSVASPQVQRCLEIKHFCSNQIASGHLLLIQTHARMDNYNLSIMIVSISPSLPLVVNGKLLSSNIHFCYDIVCKFSLDENFTNPMQPPFYYTAQIRDIPKERKCAVFAWQCQMNLIIHT